MVKIGTRAIISIAGKQMLATHWDGNPASLGRDLFRCDRSIEAVVEVAKAHTVDAADAQVIETLKREMVEQLAQKHQHTMREIKAEKRLGNFICADDYEIADIGYHKDLVEFQYDIRANEVFSRPLDGWWPEALKRAAGFRQLTAKEVASCRAE